MVERLCIRIIVATALCVAIGAFLFVPLPVDAGGDTMLPAVAFEQTGLYRLEVALLVFYGGLLLVTPAFSGLMRGRLPIEISTRGARFAEEADETVARDEAVIERLEETIARLSQRLTEIDIALEVMQEGPDEDNTQREVGSER
jgi:hypothetical protein